MQTLPQPTSIVHGNGASTPLFTVLAFTHITIADNKAILCFDAPSPSDAPNGYSPGSSAVPSSVDDVNKKISALARELSNLARMSILHPSRGMIRPLITTFVSDLAVEWPIGYIISFA